MYQVIRSVVTGLVSGYIGLHIMDPVTTHLYAMESQQDRQREKQVSPGVAYDIAARKISNMAGLQLSDEQVSIVASGFHTGLGLGAGVLYVQLRRSIGLDPFRAALVVFLLLWVGIDEGANWIFHFSAPPTAYPLATHIRGFLGHAALLAGTAITAESLELGE